jgi:peptide/nickel transport system substrate-binding protein
MKEKEILHPAINDLKVDLEKGKLTRRDFLRYATLLGMSAAAATQMAGLMWPAKAFAATPERGGVLKVAGQVHKITHPAQFSWVAPTQVGRQVAEYLTFTDGKNITHPYLLKNWVVSDDLKTWTLNARQGVKWNNGDTFTADDVIFNFSQWMNKDVGSSMLGLVGEYLDLTGIERVDQYTVKLHLKKPEIAVPEHLFHYPALIMNHRTFEGDFTKAPVGTGPYTLEAYMPGERAVVKRRNDYWNEGADGKPLPYMDGMEFIDMGTEMAPQIAALKAGEVDMIDLGDVAGVDVFQAVRNDANVQIIPVTSASTRVLRMRVDVKPWDDNKVRTALKICQHHEKLLSLVYFNEGLQGQDFHVYQLHPEYCEKPIPKYDPQRAKKLLKEAGYANGIDVNLAAGNWPDVVRYAEVLKQDAAPAGFRINIQTMPTSQYWEKWTEVDLGITPWMHRPIGTMVLNLAYITDDAGKPVPWNETRWSDPEFSKLLTQANGILNVDERRKVFCKLEDIQQQRGSIGIPYWRNAWYVLRKRVKNVHGVPPLYMTFNDAWLEA